MSTAAALLHLLNFVLPGALLGLLAAGLVKLCWRRALRSVSVLRLATWAGAAAVAASIGGLVLSGRDGAMATYAAMVIACAAALGWVGWGGR